ncbi:hypothetical protein bcgnr5390_17550 [Bacillus luti]|nr:hypothetical protein BC2903_61720 [Bacillus cereus]
MHMQGERQNNTIDELIQLTIQLYKGATDEHGEPYILHPLEAMNRAQGYSEKVTVLLYYLTANSNLTFDDIGKLQLEYETLMSVKLLNQKEHSTMRGPTELNSELFLNTYEVAKALGNMIPMWYAEGVIILNEKQIKWNHLLDTSIEISASVHKGQEDKGGTAYILHPIAVMCRVKDIITKIVGVSHDVVEDSNFTIEDYVRLGFPKEITEEIEAVTKKDDESYDAYLYRVSQKKRAIKVKLADMEENQDLTRIPNPTRNDKSRARKYKRKAKILTDPLYVFDHSLGKWVYTEGEKPNESA